MSDNGKTPVVDRVSKATNDQASGTRQLAVSGMDRFGLPTYMHDTVPQLRDRKRFMEAMRDMSENDPVTASSLLMYELLLARVDWTVAPADYGEEIQKIRVRKLVPPEQGQPTPAVVVPPTMSPAQLAAQRAAERKPVPPKPVHPEAQRAADLVSSSLEDMSMSLDDVFSQIFTMLVYGWEYSEIVYKKREGLDNDPPSAYSDGLYGWRKFMQVPQETIWEWIVDPEGGGIGGLKQFALGQSEPVPIPIEKSLLFRTTARNNNPEGRSITRPGWIPYYRKKRIEQIEGVGIERDLAGLPLIYVPQRWLLPSDEQTPAERAAFNQTAKILRNVKRDDNEGVMLPSYFDEEGNRELELSLLTSGGRRQFDTDAIVARYDQRIAMSQMTDFILLGHEKVGSYSLGASKIDLVTAAFGAWLDKIADVFNLHAIPRLLKLNGLDPRFSPMLEHSKVDAVDLDALGNFLSKTSTAGVPWFPDDALENRLRALLDWPEKQSEAEAV